MDRTENNRLIAISGGIGAGKSVVCRIVNAMGYQVYDCDIRAKEIMDESDEIKKAIATEIDADAVTGNIINRKRLSEVVFSDRLALQTLSAIVHRHVCEDISEWRTNKEISFVETAILYESGLDRMVDEVWWVSAPTELRVERVMRRNGMSRAQVLDRINSQQYYDVETPHKNIREIINDGVIPILPQIEALINH